MSRLTSAFLEMEQSLGSLLTALDPAAKSSSGERLEKVWSRVLAAYEAPAFVRSRMVVGKLGLLAGTDKKISDSESTAMFDMLYLFMRAYDRAKMEATAVGMQRTIVPGQPVFDGLYLCASMAKMALNGMASPMESADPAYRQP